MPARAFAGHGSVTRDPGIACRDVRQRRTAWAIASLLVAGIATLLHADDRAQADKLVELLALKAGMTIADVGAGSGEMTVLMAQRIGPAGTVYATDINPDRLKEIRAAAAQHDLKNVVVLEGAERTTNLPDACCDAIFIRDVYHHFSDPASMNRSLLAALKPGGRLAIIDFIPRKGSATPNGVPANRGGHGIAADLLQKEVAAAGFIVSQRDERWDGSDDLYLVLFKKP